MKYLKTYENLNEEEIGEYVYTISEEDYINKFLTLIVGEVSSKKMYNEIAYGVAYKKEDIPLEYKTLFLFSGSVNVNNWKPGKPYNFQDYKKAKFGIRYCRKNNILFHSHNKQDVEDFITMSSQTNKYNL